MKERSGGLLTIIKAFLRRKDLKITEEDNSQRLVIRENAERDLRRALGGSSFNNALERDLAAEYVIQSLQALSRRADKHNDLEIFYIDDPVEAKKLPVFVDTLAQGLYENSITPDKARETIGQVMFQYREAFSEMGIRLQVFARSTR